MLIVCPSCASSYNTPEDKLGFAGRTVRCKRCATTWFVRPPGPSDPFDAAISSIERAADSAGEIAARAAGEFPQPDLRPPMRMETTVESAEDAPAPDDPAMAARLAEASDEAPAPAPVEIDGEIVATSARAEIGPEAPARDEAKPSPVQRIPGLSAMAARLSAWPALLMRRVSAPEPQAEGVRDGTEAAASSERLIPSRRRNVFQPREAPQSPLLGRLAPYAAFAAACVAVTAVAARGPIGAVSPAMAKLYGAMGLGLSEASVAILNVNSEIAVGDAGDVLLVEGEIVSRSHDQVQIPPLRVVVRDEKGVELYAWPAQSLKLALEPGERTVFRARLASPPPAGRTVQVRFEAAAKGDARRPRTS